MVEALQRLATSLSYLWITHGYLAEGREWLERAVGQPGEEPAVRAKALNAYASIAMEAGADVDVRALAVESGGIYEQLGDASGMARSRTIQAWGTRDHDEAQRLSAEAVALTRRTGDPLRLLIALNNLGNHLVDGGEFEEATTVLEEALELSPPDRHPGSRARILDNLGFARCGLADFARAESCFRESLTMFEASGASPRATDPLLGLAAVAAAKERWERSATLLGALETLLEGVGRRLVGPELRTYEATVAGAEEQLGERMAAYVQDGRALEPEAAIAYALELPEPSL